MSKRGDTVDKFISNHKTRVQRANEYVRKSPERISIFDREAIVEFYLLEDIERLYKYRQDRVAERLPETEEGRIYRELQYEKLGYLLCMLKACIEVMQGKIQEGEFSDVWKAIHEHALMMAAGREKYLNQLISLVEEMLKDIDETTLEIARNRKEQGEFIKELRDHDINVRKYYDLPANEDSCEHINDVAQAADATVPNDANKSRLDPNTNT